jgi:hypothetical protein
MAKHKEGVDQGASRRLSFGADRGERRRLRKTAPLRREVRDTGQRRPENHLINRSISEEQ